MAIPKIDKNQKKIIILNGGILINDKKNTSLILREKEEEIKKLLKKISEDRLIFAVGLMIVTTFMGTTLMMVVIKMNFFDYILLGILAICAYAIIKAYKKSKKAKISVIEEITGEIRELVKTSNQNEASQ